MATWHENRPFPQLPSKKFKKKHRCRVSGGCNPKQTDGLVLVVILPFYPRNAPRSRPLRWRVIQEQQTVGQSGIRRRTWGNSDVCVGPMLGGTSVMIPDRFFRKKKKQQRSRNPDTKNIIILLFTFEWPRCSNPKSFLVLVDDFSGIKGSIGRRMLHQLVLNPLLLTIRVLKSESFSHLLTRGAITLLKKLTAGS